MQLDIPKLSLVVMVGPSGSGKSSFARKHFKSTEVISSDFCRGILSDDENNQSVTDHAFELLHYIAAKRLQLGKLTVIDATNVQPEARKPLVELARAYHCLPVAIVLDMPERVCHDRNQARTDRNFGPHVIKNQKSQLARNIRNLQREGFRHVHILRSPEEVDRVTIQRKPLWNDKTAETGPFDIIGDIHGCATELELLLGQLGYQPAASTAETVPLSLAGGPTYAHPAGRRAVFVGDLVDRGPRTLDTLRIVRNMVHAGSAFCVPGNHDVKLLRKLTGKNVQVTHGLAETLAELDALPEDIKADFNKDLIQFIDGLVSHYVFDGGNLVVAHAGLKESMHGRGSGQVREFALFGETTGETDEFGLPVRHNWAAEYRGRATVVYGHTPVPRPEWLNSTINIDTGCVFGGGLTSLRYPEREIVTIPARQTYCQPARPFLTAETPAAPAFTAQQQHDQLLNAEDVIGKRLVGTRLRGKVTIRQENSAAALEVMSRFAVDPRWLIYLPPTMSPCETATEPGFLEAPAGAFQYYLNEGLTQVICQQKHMGSRAIAIVCRDEQAALKRFGVDTGQQGTIYTRTGRPFFHDSPTETAFLDRIRQALTTSDFWATFETDWVCLDCELMPWSAKAQELIRTQYASVGAAATMALPLVIQTLQNATARLAGDHQARTASILADFNTRLQNAAAFRTAYRQYCWPVQSLADYRLAPFHIMATEGHVHTDKDHRWHMAAIADICKADPDFLLQTNTIEVNLNNPVSIDQATRWWHDLTGSGGEGMVVKPFDFISKGTRGLAQPAVKCRGREYLRIIYGPDYDTPANLPRLRSRGLNRKRNLALNEFALGLEALERFTRREPLRRVHECVFGVLALESEPLDPRL